MIKTLTKVLLLLVFVCGACVAASNLYTIFAEYRAGEKTYTQLQQHAQAPAVVSAVETEFSVQASPVGTAAPAPAFPVVDFSFLQQQNADTVGWVCIENTNINYPVVQGADNRYYVSTMFDGTQNKAGSIFMDYRNNPNMEDKHTILYGHNMRNKSMFADILNYQSQEYYDAHPLGMYITPEQNYCFDIVAGYVASIEDTAWQLEFVTDQDAMDWLKEAIARSAFQSTVQLKPGDRYITLSTCSYEFDDARFVLVGVLRQC